jgi:hypothetical protein
VNSHLVLAIHNKRLIEFVYKNGRPRIIEPHDYGIRKGVKLLLAYQVSGDSTSGAPHGWRTFTVADMDYLRVLDRQFLGTRADASQHHLTWDVLFARVN